MANEQLSASANRPTGTATVVIGCKLPHGLYLEHVQKRDGWNPAPAGPRVKLNGANSVQTNSLVKVQPRIHQFGKTIIDKSFWDKWLADHESDDHIKMGRIFVIDPKGGESGMQRSFDAQHNEKLGVKTGLEGLNPEGKDERLDKIQIPGQPETKVESDLEHLGKLKRSLDA